MYSCDGKLDSDGHIGVAYFLGKKWAGGLEKIPGKMGQGWILWESFSGCNCNIFSL